MFLQIIRVLAAVALIVATVLVYQVAVHVDFATARMIQIVPALSLTAGVLLVGALRLLTSGSLGKIFLGVAAMTVVALLCMFSLKLTNDASSKIPEDQLQIPSTGSSQNLPA